MCFANVLAEYQQWQRERVIVASSFWHIDTSHTARDEYEVDCSSFSCLQSLVCLSAFGILVSVILIPFPRKL